MLLIVRIILFTLTLNWVGADIFTSLVDMEALPATHSSVIHSLESYLDEENRRLERLNRYLIQYKNEHKKMEEKNGSDYILNPANSLTLIKHLTADLDSVERLVNLRNAFNKQPEALFPTSEDLEGAVMSISRLQSTYGLNATQLADGKLYGTFSHGGKPFEEQSSPMSATDCFEIGRVLCDNKDYEIALQWLQLALHRSKHEPQELINFSEARLVDYIRCANQGLKSVAVKPTYPQAVRELCRGNRPHVTDKSLYCYYKTGPEPFLFLARVKTELLSLDPEVRMFYDVISDAEINTIQDLAKPTFTRSKVGMGYTTPNRISKTSWVSDDQSPDVARVSQRVADVTELSMLTAEPLQVVNYGIGGHNSLHNDGGVFKCADIDTKSRLATILFYLSDVDQGGATVFPRLNLTVFPTKYSAVLFYDMHASGDSDIRVEHAGCPILRGTKWVFTKWIKYWGQEFHRPCNLKPEEN